jgi:hypothetical protein
MSVPIKDRGTRLSWRRIVYRDIRTGYVSASAEGPDAEV